MNKQFKISPTTKQVLMLGAVILIIRILYIDLYQGLQAKYNFALSDYISSLLADYVSLIAIFCLNIIFVLRLSRRVSLKLHPMKRVGCMLAYIILISIAITALVNRGYLASAPLSELHLIKGEVAFSFLAVMLVNSLFVIVVDMILYMRNSRVALASEKDRRHKAQYQYLQLKQQLNPHFLFNSLNMLDYLVQNDDKERASEFIRKLAGVYRYLLRQGEEPIVRLKDELEFIDKYVDLLKERFNTGLAVEIDIPQKYMARGIVPCGLQILVENAVKHNVVNAEKPLRINIYIENNHVIVRNNLQLRYGHSTSNGVGLSNLEAQYKDIADIDISVKQTENNYIVKLPLL